MTMPAKAAVRVATFCDCGKPIAGFPGVLACGCGRLFSVSRMALDLGNATATAIGERELERRSAA